MPQWCTALGVLVSFVAVISGTLLGIIATDTDLAAHLVASGSVGIFATSLAVWLFDER